VADTSKATPCCDGCRHWSRDDDDGRRAGDMKVRLCSKAPQWWDATEWTDEPDPENKFDNLRRVLPEHEGTKMFVQDGSDYRAELFTTADFFCAHFEERP
jgi:hypothetical protein